MPLLAGADAPVSSTRMRVAAATALGAAAVKAKMLADAEEREVQHQVQIAVEAQMQKVQLKLNSMKQLDEALEKERTTMEVGNIHLLFSFLSNGICSDASMHALCWKRLVLEACMWVAC